MNHSFDCDVAAKYGMLEAVLIHNFQHWIKLNRDNNRNFRDGRTWTYNSVKALHKQYHYISSDKIRRALDKLEEAGVLVKGVYNELPGDRTTWYAFADEAYWIPDSDHLASMPNGVGSDAKPFGTSAKSTNKTDVNTDRKPDSRARGTRLPQEWFLTKVWAEEARVIQPSWTDDHIRFEADKFKDHWVAVSGQKGVKVDWLATWRNWCRNAGPTAAAKASSGSWWASDESKLAKAMEVGVGPAHRGEPDSAWQARIRAAIENGGKPPEAIRPAQAITIRDPDAVPAKAVISDENRAALLAAKQALKRNTGLSPVA
jgi:hypothetical protein